MTGQVLAETRQRSIVRSATATATQPNQKWKAASTAPEQKSSVPELAPAGLNWRAHRAVGNPQTAPDEIAVGGARPLAGPKLRREILRTSAVTRKPVVASRIKRTQATGNSDSTGTGNSAETPADTSVAPEDETAPSALDPRDAADAAIIEGNGAASDPILDEPNKKPAAKAPTDATEKPEADSLDEPPMELTDPDTSSAPKSRVPGDRPSDVFSDEPTEPTPNGATADPMPNGADIETIPPGNGAEATTDIEGCDDEKQDCRDDLKMLREATLAKASMDFINIRLAGTEGRDFPCECPFEGEEFVPRCWAQTVFTWKAAATCHKPLYFEDVHLERYGHSWCPLAQPFISGAHFFASVPLLPYQMGMYPPDECIYTLGYYRPGNCAPYLIDPIPISIRGGLLQAAAVVGAVFIIP